MRNSFKILGLILITLMFVLAYVSSIRAYQDGFEEGNFLGQIKGSTGQWLKGYEKGLRDQAVQFSKSQNAPKEPDVSCALLDTNGWQYAGTYFADILYGDVYSVITVRGDQVSIWAPDLRAFGQWYIMVPKQYDYERVGKSLQILGCMNGEIWIHEVPIPISPEPSGNNG